MRKFASIVLAICMVLGLATFASAEEQYFEVKITDLIDNYGLLTKWGNVFFNDRDIKRLTHAAANLKPISLGDFKTDKGHMVMVKSVNYKAGMAKLVVTVVKLK